MHWHIVTFIGCLAVAAGCSGSSGGGGYGPLNDDAGAGGGEGGELTDGAGGGGDTGDGSNAPGDAPTGGRGDSGGGGDPAIAAACTAASHAQCSKLDFCSRFFLDLEFGDVATCTQRLVLECAKQLSAPGIAVTPSVIEGCAQAMGPVTCGELFDGKLPSACAPVPGQLAGGAACGDGDQCKGNDCRKPTGSYCGTCTSLASSGQSCASADCALGLVCSKITHVCTPYEPLGGTCDANHLCGFPMACKAGHCVQPSPLGAACTTTGDECNHAKGLACNAVSHKCAQLKLAMPGQTCGAAADGTMTACSHGALCKPASAAATTGTCLAPALDGAACSDVNGPLCMPPAYCDTGSCKLPDPTLCH